MSDDAPPRQEHEEPIPGPPAGEAVPFWAHLLPFFGFFFISHMLENLEPWNWLGGAVAALTALAWQKPWRDRAVWAHVMPFALWIALMTGLGDPAGWKYAIRSLVCAAALIAARPWRWYEPLRWKNLGWAMAVGFGVFAIWVGFESPWFKQGCPALAQFYERWLVGPIPDGFGKLREPLAGSPYDPATTGWGLFAIHLLGTSVVIAIIEEFFWRGFLYRWLSGKNFLRVPIRHWDRAIFWGVAVLFGIEHAEWLAGILCGLAFAWILLRTGDIWAVIIAHGVTNFILSWYVLVFRQWHFW